MNMLSRTGSRLFRVAAVSRHVRSLSSSSGELPSALRPDGSRDPILFTPGPLTTSYATKAAALIDMGSRDPAFIECIAEIRSGLLRLAAVQPSEYTCVPLQGSGTFGVEGTLTSVMPARKKMLIAVNGAYGERIAKIASVHQIPFVKIDSGAEDLQVTPEAVDQALSEHPDIHLVAVIHSETTSGIVNPIQEIGEVVSRKHGKQFFVDAMSSFGGIPIDFTHIDYLVSSSNKCIEGIPGFSFVIAKSTSLDACEGSARTLSLDLHAQRKGLDANGQFRFTPPTHALLAFRQAMKELEQEGGIQARYTRYRALQETVVQGLEKLGFHTYLSEALRGPIITSFRYPTNANWSFNSFYQKLSDRGLLIYPGKVSNADCFRIGHIGRLTQHDMQALVQAIDEIMQEIK